MGILQNGGDGSLLIERMIFHVVGLGGKSGPTILEEISPPEHADFFLERIRYAFRGNLYRFNDGSAAHGWLKAIVERPAEFADRSADLAREFARLHGKTTSDGVFFVFSLVSTGGGRMFALIKYDIDDVVNYSLKNTGKKVKPELRRLRENFVRKAEAMQKVALVELGDGGGIAVKDRSHRSGISKYFEDFLNVSRVHSEKDLSLGMNAALTEVLKRHRPELPPAIRRSGLAHVAEALRKEPEFDADDPGAFLDRIFGPRPDESAMLETFGQALAKSGLATESFKVSKAHIPTPTHRRLETAEGVKIVYDLSQAGHTVEELQLGDGRTEIKITTAGYTVDDAEPDRDRGSRRGQ